MRAFSCCALIIFTVLLGGCRSTTSVLLDTPALKVTRTDRDDYNLMFSRWDRSTTFQIHLNGKKLSAADYGHLIFGKEPDDAVPGYRPTHVIVLDSRSILVRVRYDSSMATAARTARVVMDKGGLTVQALTRGSPAELGFFDVYSDDWVGMYDDAGRFLLIRRDPWDVYSLPGTYLAQISDRVVITFDKEMSEQGGDHIYMMRALDIQTGKRLAEYAFDATRYYPPIPGLPGFDRVGWFRSNFRFEMTPEPDIHLRPNNALRPRP